MGDALVPHTIIGLAEYILSFVVAQSAMFRGETENWYKESCGAETRSEQTVMRITSKKDETAYRKEQRDGIRRNGKAE
jgi:hypothetical protein